MVKKIISVLLSLFLISNVCYADTVRDKIGQMLIAKNADKNADLSYINICKNRYFLSADDKQILANAIKNGIYLPIDGIADLDSDDMQPIINGITKSALTDKYSKIVYDNYINSEIAKGEVDDSTVKLNFDEFDSTSKYTAVINSANKCIVCWKSDVIHKPMVIKGTIYIASDDELVIKNPQRYSMNYWINDVTKLSFIGMSYLNTGLTKEIINSSMLDKNVYIYCDNDGDNYKILNVLVGE